MLTLDGVIETSLYVDDPDVSAAFYRRLFNFPTLFEDRRAIALNVADRQVLLLFRKGTSAEKIDRPTGSIPGHDGHGTLHLAFGIDLPDVPSWRQRLESAGIFIESEMKWERGGVSLYFRDPDRHLVELVTPGVWAIR
jgi:catechol 2,3-dioxygenase-like lactoylglutathione lyase family enzyme